MIEITKVNEANGTFAGTYVRAHDSGNQYDVRGEFDTEGTTLGWTVQLDEEQDPNHRSSSAVTWCGHSEGESQRPTIVVTLLNTTYGRNSDGDYVFTVPGFDVFIQEPYG